MGQYNDLADKIKQAKQKIRELSATISIYAMAPVSREVKAKEQELHDRLQFRLAELELQGLETKISFMKRLVEILTSKKN